MAGSGYAQKVYVIGKDDEAVIVDGGGLHVTHSYPQYISFRFRITDDENGTSLPDIPCSLVIIRNATDTTQTNQPIYIDGIGASASSTDSIFLRDDESWQMPIDNTSKINLHCSVPQDIRVAIYVNSNTEVDLTDVPNVNLPFLDTVAPTVVSTTPTNGATDVERDTTIEKVMDEAIDPETVTTANFSISPAPPAPGTWTVGVDSLDNTKLFLNPDSTLASATVYTITLQNVTDLSGNALAAPSVTTFTTKAAAPPADVTPPTITTKDPVPDATNISISKAPKIIFSEDMLSSTINTTTIKLREVSTTNLVTCTVSLGADKKTVTITPTASLNYSFVYQIEVTGGSSGVKDLAGNPLAADDSWQFTTAAQSYTLVYNVSANDDNRLSSDDSEFAAIYVANSDSEMNGIIPTKVVARLHKTGSPTGNINCSIYDETGTFVKALGSPISAASLTTTSTEYTFTASTNTVALEVGWTISISFTGGNDSNYVNLKRNTSNPFDGTNTYELEDHESGSGVDHNTGYDLAMKVYVSP